MSALFENFFKNTKPASGHNIFEVKQMTEKEKTHYDDQIRSKVPLTDSEKPISEIYPVIDTDLGRDNVENDIPDADLQDL